MSWWRTRCNFCTMAAVTTQAKQTGGVVIIQPKALEGFPEGIDVFIDYQDGKPPSRACWLAKLPKECHCDD